MTIPLRGRTGQGTYFITASTDGKRHILRSPAMAGLLVDVLLHYRNEGNYRLHEFVVMPNHFHLLITPEKISLERALQLIKGGFSYRARKELGFLSEIWQTSFYDHRVRDLAEYCKMRDYIHNNPVRRGLADASEAHPYSSAHPGFVLDEVPQRLKPVA